MDEESKANILETLEKVVTATSDTMSQQMPLLAREIVNWHMLGGALLASLSALIGICMFYFAWLCYKKTVNGEGDLGETTILLCALGAIMGFSAGSGIAMIAKGIVAPRMIVVEYVKSQIQ